MLKEHRPQLLSFPRKCEIFETNLLCLNLSGFSVPLFIYKQVSLKQRAAVLTVKLKELGLCLTNLLPLNLGIAGITRKNWLSNHSLANLVRENSHAWSGYSEIGFLRQSWFCPILISLLCR